MVEKSEKIELTSNFSLKTLSVMKRRLDQEIEVSLFSIHKLQMQKKKYADIKEMMDLSKNGTVGGEDLLVPLTRNVYFPASVVASDRYLVGLGGGYWVEKSSKDAIECYKRKVARLYTEIEKMLKSAHIKVNLREKIVEAIQYRQQETLAIQFIAGKIKDDKSAQEEDDENDSE